MQIPQKMLKAILTKNLQGAMVTYTILQKIATKRLYNIELRKLLKIIGLMMNRKKEDLKERE